MKRLLILILLIPLSLPLSSLAKEQPLDSIVATVNNSIITQSALDRLANSARLAQQGRMSHQALLNQAIDTELQLQAAKDAGLSASSQDIDTAIADIAQGNGVSAKVLLQKVVAAGMSVSTYRQQLHDQILMQKIQQVAVMPKVVINPATLNAALQRAATQKTVAPRGALEYQLQSMQKPAAQLTPAQVRQQVYMQQYQKVLQQWLAQLRASAIINLHPNH